MVRDSGDGEREGARGLRAVSDLVEIAGRMRASTVAVPGGHRAEDLRLVESARDHGIVDRILLIGGEKLIRDAVERVGIDIPGGDIVAADDDERIAEETVRLIREGAVDVVLKGGISTPVINRHLLRTARRPTVSLATLFDAAPVAGGRPMILTDAGVTTACTFGRMVHLVQNALEVARLVLGTSRPRVAVLSANEKQIPSLPSTRMGLALAGLHWPGAVVCGPLSFDLATDPLSVEVKGLPDLPGAREVAGRADVLVCPGIDAANILYKTITAMTKYGQASLAGVTVGFPVPYVILSRADTLDTRLNSIALCSIYAQGLQVKEEHPPAAGGCTAAGAVRVHESLTMGPVVAGTGSAGVSGSRGSGDLTREEVQDVASAAAAAAEASLRPPGDGCVLVARLDRRCCAGLVERGAVVQAARVDTARREEQRRGSAQSAAFPGDEALVGELGRLYALSGGEVEAVVLAGPGTDDGERVRGLRSRLARLAPVTVVTG